MAIMWNWLRALFTPRTTLRGGGEGCCEVLDRFGRVVGTIWYRRPTSNDRLDFAYQQQHALAESDHGLREIQQAKNKARTIHGLMLRDLHIPFAERIFKRCSGYRTEDGNPVDKLPPDQQFQFLRTYYAEHLSDFVSQVYAVEGVVKKKF